MELRHLLEILWRRRGVIAVVFGAVVLFTLFLTISAIPRYTVTSKVLLRKSTLTAGVLMTLGFQAGRPTSESVSDEERASLEAIATSRPVLTPVVDDLRLTRDRRRTQLVKLLPFSQTVFEALGVQWSRRPLTYDEFVKSGMLALLFPRPSVEVSQHEDSDVLAIEGTSTSIEEAVDVANSVAASFKAYMGELMEQDFAVLQQAVTREIPPARDRYERALQAYADYSRQARTVDVDEEAIVLSQLKSELARERDQIRLQLLETRARLQNVQEQLETIPEYKRASSDIVRNPLIAAMENTMSDLALELARARTQYTEKHPQVVELKARLEEARDVVAEEAKTVMGSVVTNENSLYRTMAENYATLMAGETGLEQQEAGYDVILQELDEQLDAFPEVQAQLSRLGSARDAAQSYYEALVEMQSQLETAQALPEANVVLVEAAVIPHPDDLSRFRSPSRSISLAFAIIMGGFMGLGVALLLEYMDDAIRSPEDLDAVGRQGGATFLGAVPKAGRHTRDIAALPPGHPVREALRMLRPALLNAAARTPDSDRSRLMLWTTYAHGHDLGLCCVGVATALAWAGERVCIVDMDPNSLADYAGGGARQNQSRSDRLAALEALVQGGGAAEAWAFAATTLRGGEGQSAGGVVVAVEAAALPAESATLRRLLGLALDRYDVVFVRLPPALDSGDAVLLAHSDRPVFEDAAASHSLQPALMAAVMRAGRTPRSGAARLVSLLKGHPADPKAQRDAPPLGLILTGVEQPLGERAAGLASALRLRSRQWRRRRAARGR